MSSSSDRIKEIKQFPWAFTLGSIYACLPEDKETLDIANQTFEGVCEAIKYLVDEIEKRTGSVKWYPRDIPPSNVTLEYRYFQVWNGKTMSYRVYEEGTWWLHSYTESDEYGQDGGWKLVPNSSFTHWAHIEPPTESRTE